MEVVDPEGDREEQPAAAARRDAVTQVAAKDFMLRVVSNWCAASGRPKPRRENRRVCRIDALAGPEVALSVGMTTERSLSRRFFANLFTHGTGALLILTAIYLYTIKTVSPHPLPGLGAASGLVFFSGCAAILAATRYVRLAASARILAFGLGVIAVGAVGLAVRTPRAHVAMADRAH